MRVVILYNRPAGADHPNAEASLDVLAQVETVESALSGLGIGTSISEIRGDLRSGLNDLIEASPDIVFNLVEAVDEDPLLYPNIAGLLELLRVPFTGSGSCALAISTDKRLAKLALRGAGLPTPEWVVYRGDRDFTCSGFPPPWMVKPNFEDASIGIDDRSVYASERRLLADLPALLEKHAGQPLLIERYIDGREFNLSLLEDGLGFEILPAAEIDFSALPEGKPRIVGYRAKWDTASFEHGHTPRMFARDESDALVCRLRALAKQACETLGVRGYARVDFRVTESLDPLILEVNANPCLSRGAGFMAAAVAAGLTAAETIGRILAAAGRRG